MPEKNTSTIGFEKQIWEAACVLRGNMDASEYKSVVLGLIFLKYISDRFEAKHQELVEEGYTFGYATYWNANILQELSGGKVEVAVSAGDTAITVSVKDTGIGIPPEYQARVFERFFWVDKSRSKASGGTGLGLSIVKHIAQYHHAEIKLHSGNGRGTIIEILFAIGEM